MNTTQRKKKKFTQGHKNDRKRECQGKRKRNAFDQRLRHPTGSGMHKWKGAREKQARTVGGSEGVMRDTKEEKQKEAKVMHGSFPLLLQNLGQTCKGKESQSFQRQRRLVRTRRFASNCAFCGYHRVQPRSSRSFSNKTPLKPKHTGTSGEKVPKKLQWQ